MCIRLEQVSLNNMRIQHQRINNIKRMSALNRGNAKVVLFDESRRMYCAMRDLRIAPSDKVMTKLIELFGDGNVIFKI